MIFAFVPLMQNQGHNSLIIDRRCPSNCYPVSPYEYPGPHRDRPGSEACRRAPPDPHRTDCQHLSPMNIDFGVEVTRPFSPSGEVALVETPAGSVATAVHIGPYDQLRRTHDAIHVWAARNRMSFAGKSWEIYGDPSDDIMKLETRVDYLLS